MLQFFDPELQEALGKFDVESEPANAINIEPSNGNLNLDGTALLHCRRNFFFTCNW